MDDKIGTSLDEIHISGNVPKCECYKVLYGSLAYMLSQSRRNSK